MENVSVFRRRPASAYAGNSGPKTGLANPSRIANNGLPNGIVLTWRPGSVCRILGSSSQITFSLDRANIQ